MRCTISHLLLLSVACLLLLLQAGAANWRREVDCSSDKKYLCGQVVSVHDADTIRISSSSSKRQKSVKVRLNEIDAPELSQAFGQSAQAALQRKLPIGSRVCVVSGGRDFYHRLLGFVCQGSEDVNKWLLRNGLAWCYKNRCSSSYKQQVQQARAARRGLWRQAQPQSPWRFRRLRRREGKAWL